MLTTLKTWLATIIIGTPLIMASPSLAPILPATAFASWGDINSYSSPPEPDIALVAPPIVSVADHIVSAGEKAALRPSIISHLIEIAKCESGLRQFNPDGTLYRGEVHPADAGVFQINEEAHGVYATKAGYNVEKLDDNIAFAIKLYIAQGDGPWSASKPCWSKSPVR